jgi:hypothetical protein
VRFKLTQGEDMDVLSRLYFQYTGPAPTVAQCNALALVAWNEWSTVMYPYFTPDVSLVEVDVQDLASATGASGNHVATTAGTRSGTRNAAGVAVLLNYHIARRYRGGKPRVYLPALDATDLTDEQTWNPGQLANVVTEWNAVIAGIIAAPWSGATITGHVNVSYYSGFASVQNPVTHRWKNISTPRAVPLIDAVTAVTGNPRPGSQRRRNLHGS